MAYFFTPEELPDNKYYFLERRSKNLAEDLESHSRRNTYCTIHTRSRRLRSSCSDANSICSGEHFDEVTRNVVQETVNRNENLPASEAVKITTMAGFSSKKKIENRKLEDVLIVKLITACKNYVIITLSHHKDMTTEELTQKFKSARRN
jgi:hypothetical protein